MLRPKVSFRRVDQSRIEWNHHGFDSDDAAAHNPSPPATTSSPPTPPHTGPHSVPSERERKLRNPHGMRPRRLRDHPADHKHRPAVRPVDRRLSLRVVRGHRAFAVPEPGVPWLLYRSVPVPPGNRQDGHNLQRGDGLRFESVAGDGPHGYLGPRLRGPHRVYVGREPGPGAQRDPDRVCVGDFASCAERLAFGQELVLTLGGSIGAPYS